MDCSTCKSNSLQTIPYIAHEQEMARRERTEKRLWITIILLIVLLVGSNAGWMYYESQFTDTVTTQEVVQEADNGNNSFIGGDVYGETNH